MSTTLAHRTTLAQFDAALRDATSRAVATFPAEQCRIMRGAQIALADGVTLHADGTATVQSQTDATRSYTVNGTCPCPDAARAPHGRCKHLYAKWLTKAALATVRRHPGPDRWYATYYAPEGSAVPGVATWDAARHCYLFVPDEGGAPLYPALAALSLGGHIATAEAQRAQDGNLVAKVCGYA